jgi:hypothetical protein
MMTRSIESAAFLEPIWNRPELIGGRLIRVRLDQATVDHDLPYDALILDLLGLRRLIEWPSGECR